GRICSRNHIISWLKSATAITEQDTHATVVIYCGIPKIHRGKIHLAVSVKISKRHGHGIRADGIAVSSLEPYGTVCRKAEQNQNCQNCDEELLLSHGAKLLFRLLALPTRKRRTVLVRHLHHSACP